jgi:SHAQKYF class myb-like DNA-binding protein
MAQQRRRNVRKRKRIEDESDRLNIPVVKIREIASTDAESAALIEAMLIQDQYDNPYFDDFYGNNFDTADDKKHIHSDDEDDDFVPERLKRELRELQRRGSRKKRKANVQSAVSSVTPSITQCSPSPSSPSAVTPTPDISTSHTVSSFSQLPRSPPTTSTESSSQSTHHTQSLMTRPSPSHNEHSKPLNFFPINSTCVSFVENPPSVIRNTLILEPIQTPKCPPSVSSVTAQQSSRIQEIPTIETTTTNATVTQLSSSSSPSKEKTLENQNTHTPSQDTLSEENSENRSEEREESEKAAENEISAESKKSEKKPRKYREKNPNFNYGPWSEDEEARFLKALELFGRNWSQIAAYIKTRDKSSIRSHAQKYFIRCYRDNIPLPPKVLESGGGHTLSGKPLNPLSASAAQCLGRSFYEQHGLPIPPRRRKKSQQKDVQNEEQNTESKNVERPPTSPSEENKPTVARKSTKKKEKRPFRESDLGLKNIGTLLYGDSLGTYSKDRLRNRKSISWAQLGNDTDPLTMVRCSRYASPEAQPLKIFVHSNAMLLADLHAHLSQIEIIGFLGGKWEPDKLTITIEEAFPCKSLTTADDSVNVEMDPESEYEIRETIEKKNMHIVGWYHSHPAFQPDPSLRDIENQTNYQILFRDEQHKRQPFVGVIIGTYDTRLKTEESIINWFHVETMPEYKGQPMYMVHSYINDETVPQTLEDNIFKLLEEYKSLPKTYKL